MRSVTPFPIALALLACAALPAFAQSEDEQILQQEPAQASGGEAGADNPKQHPKDEDLDDEDLDEQVFYSGLGIDRVSTDFDNLGEATNLQAVLGFRIPTVKWIGLEIDLAQTLIPGDYRDPDPGSPGTPGTCGAIPTPGCIPATDPTPPEDGAFDPEGDEFAMQALGLSLALKSPGRFYVMGRYGFRYLATSNEALNEDRSSEGFGVGLGYRWGRGLSGVELAYKELAEDVESIGLTFYVRSRR